MAVSTPSLSREFGKYVSLNMLGMLGLSCYILADTFFVANRLGPQGLAALNLSIPLYSVVNGAGLMLGVGGATRYGVLKAQGLHREGNQVFTHALIGALGLGLLFLTLGVFWARPLGKLLGAEGEVLPMTESYLSVLLAFAPFFLLNNVAAAFLRNDGAPRLAMAGMLLGSFSNILLDWVFLYPLSWGMGGAAFATGLAPIISLGLLSVRFWRGRNGFRPVRTRLSLRAMARLCAPGLSAMATELASACALIVYNLLILNLEGDVGVAAYGIVANLALVATALFTGISQGMQPLVSRSYGQRDREGMAKVLKSALPLALGLAGTLYLLALLGAGPLTAAFNGEEDPHLGTLAERGLRLYFTGFFFAGSNLVTAAFFCALEQGGKGFAISFLRGFGLLIPLAALLSRFLGMDGVWLSFPAVEGVTLLLAVCWLLGWGRQGAGKNRREDRL